MKISISHKKHGKFWLVRYKVVGPNKYTITLSGTVDDAGDFDEDDYNKELCEDWFGEINGN